MKIQLTNVLLKKFHNYPIMYLGQGIYRLIMNWDSIGTGYLKVPQFFNCPGKQEFFDLKEQFQQCLDSVPINTVLMNHHHHHLTFSFVFAPT